MRLLGTAAAAAAAAARRHDHHRQRRRNRYAYIVVISISGLFLLVSNLKVRTKNPTTFTVYIENARSRSHQHRRKKKRKKKKKEEEADVLDELDALSDGPKAKSLRCPDPLVPFENIIVRSSSSSSSSPPRLLIPRILHVSYKSRCLPRDIANHLRLWSRALPNYSIFLHDDESVHKLMYGDDTNDDDTNDDDDDDDVDDDDEKDDSSTNNPQRREWTHLFGPHFYDALNCVLLKGVMTIDVWRILILYKYGGIYTDTDNAPILPTFHESYPIRPDAYSFFVFATPKHGRLSHWFFASEPSHPILTFAMERILHQVVHMADIKNPTVMHVTGPYTLQTAYMQFLANTTTTTTTTPPYTTVVSGTTGDYTMNDVVLTGYQNKTAYKKSSYDDTLIVNFTWKPNGQLLVPYNATTSVTIQERYAYDKDVLAAWWSNDTANKNNNNNNKKDVPGRRYDAGVMHWTESKVYVRSRLTKIFHEYNISSTCRGYNEQLKEGSVPTKEALLNMLYGLV